MARNQGGYNRWMLTDTSAKKLEPRAAPYRVADRAGVPGFGLQVFPSGAKSWFLRLRRGPADKFLHLGHFPPVPASAARQKAREALARWEQGIDPTLPPPAPLGSFADLLAAWLDHQRDAGRRSLADVERVIRANCGPLMARPVDTITPADLRAVLAPIHQRDARTLANRLRAHLHALWRYGIRHDHDPRTLHRAVRFGLTSNPVEAIPRDAQAERVGERVLTWAEVREAWRSERLSWPSRQAIRLLLVTGARVNEIVQAPWSEFDLDAGLWTLPASRSKNRRDHVLPLPDLALELLAALRGLHPDGAWLFPWRNAARAAKPWNNSSLSHLVRVAGYDWTPRDVRRTVKTLAINAGIDKAVLDRVQNHAQSDVSSRHYDRDQHLAAKRQALETWAHALSARLAGDNVIALHPPSAARDAG